MAVIKDDIIFCKEKQINEPNISIILSLHVHIALNILIWKGK